MTLPGWAFWVAILFLIVGLLGVLLPAVPGVGFMWIVILVYAIAERFAAIDPLSFAILTILGLAGATSDYWLALLGAKVGGASMRSTLLSIAGGMLGALIGLFFGGIGAIPGAWIGSIAGVTVSEWIERKDWKAALRATLGLVVGFTLSTGVQLVLGVLMFAVFVWQVLRG